MNEERKKHATNIVVTMMGAACFEWGGVGHFRRAIDGIRNADFCIVLEW
jgi:hypothetical protein